MPKRIIDGDRLWTSEKLRAVEPEEYRPEYANLIPLALANGSFECEPIRVQRDVYFYLRPSLSLADVNSILKELERVRLLFRWKDEVGKTWGYWVGIEADGLLPSDSKMKHYKKGPVPPSDLLDRFIKGEIPSGLCEDNVRTSGIPCADYVPQGLVSVLDRIGIGSGEQEEEILEDGQEENMKLKKEIQVVCAGYGVKAGGYDETWEQMSALEQAHSRGAVVRGFTEFMNENQGDDFPKGAVSAYLRVAVGRLASGVAPASVAAKDPQVKALEAELIYLSDDRVTFQAGHKVVLEELLREHSPEEVISAFKTFIENKDLNDPKVLNFAAKNFVDAANGLVLSAHRRQNEKDRDVSQRELAKSRLQAEAEDERITADSEKKSEDNLFDPLADVV